MANLTRLTAATFSVPQIRPRCLNTAIASQGFAFPRVGIRCLPVCCTSLTPWEPSSVTYAPSEGTTNIFEALKSEGTSETPTSSAEKETDIQDQPSLRFLKWPMWILGPSLLLATGMVPTLWLPISSVFLGPNISSLLSLIGLDCIFNLGATLFLLMADSCAHPKSGNSPRRAPLSYQFWNMVASITGFFIPILMILSSHKGFLQPQLPFISFAILLGPYILLLSVQMLTEMLTWHWESPVWLVTPVVYEAYRVLQLMRGLKLGAELGAPAWAVHTIRAMVCWWVFILGVQLMRVAWFAGFAARGSQHDSSAVGNGV